MGQNPRKTTDSLEQKDAWMKTDICIIARISRTIGADRGRAARGAPGKAR